MVLTMAKCYLIQKLLFIIKGAGKVKQEVRFFQEDTIQRSLTQKSNLITIFGSV